MQMKTINLILFFLVAMPAFLFAQEPINYEGVVEVEGADTKELLKRGQIWLAETFVDSKEVTEYKGDDVLVGRGAFPFKSKRYIGYEASEGVINYTIKLMFKDGRYKYQFSNYIHEGNTFSAGQLTDATILMNKSTLSASKGWANKTFNELKERAAERAELIIENLKKGMQNESNNSDW